MAIITIDISAAMRAILDFMKQCFHFLETTYISLFGQSFSLFHVLLGALAGSILIKILLPLAEKSDDLNEDIDDTVDDYIDID